jgi:hypothetical protein
VVARPLRLLGLDREIPLRGTTEEALSSLEDIHPEAVDLTGEYVTFLLPNAADAFGARARRGRLEERDVEGLAFSFENLDDSGPEVVFPAGAPIRLWFILPLRGRARVFRKVGIIRSTEKLGGRKLLVRVTLPGEWGEETLGQHADL